MKTLKLVNLLPIRKFKTFEESMRPTINPGDEVIVFAWGEVGVGDVVVVRFEHTNMIKRVRWIEDDRYYLLGDNPRHSVDSRRFGPVSRVDIIGRVVYIRKG